ncbi:hypothetical protein F4820DRAFT_334923 [Hypoxylon rubiginosum]|uniref:Uncharacterized protein n=1 Tax=Hypoxylon rubiginosum TaxID=110542 RepID=A0ACB9YZY5_9PEZI|nr:hypothetical protein F4820DRAFT_334923 [Hypoxylon rubiginosum]
MYGCTSSIITEVISRLSRCELSTFHPLTLPTIVADIERNRHINMVGDYVSKLMQRVLDIGQEIRTSTPTCHSSTSESEKPDISHFNPPRDLASVMDWLEMRHIRNGLENWKTELQMLVHHIAELGRVHHDMIETSTGDVAQDMKRQGVRIHERLIQIINEYDGKIRECSRVIDGLSFATQMEWNQIARADTNTNLEISSSTMEISRATQKDGSQMRFVALLTMIFLPGTFVAVSLQVSPCR